MVTTFMLFSVEASTLNTQGDITLNEISYTDEFFEASTLDLVESYIGDAESVEVKEFESDINIMQIDILHTVDQTNAYTVEKELTTLILYSDSISSNLANSGGKYSIAYSSTVYYTLYYDSDLYALGDMSVKISSVTGTYYDNSASYTVKTFSAYATYGVEELIEEGISEYRSGFSISYPTSGTTYSKTINSSTFDIDGGNLLYNVTSITLTNGVSFGTTTCINS